MLDLILGRTLFSKENGKLGGPFKAKREVPYKPRATSGTDTRAYGLVASTAHWDGWLQALNPSLPGGSSRGPANKKPKKNCSKISDLVHSAGILPATHTPNPREAAHRGGLGSRVARLLHSPTPHSEPLLTLLVAGHQDPEVREAAIPPSTGPCRLPVRRRTNSSLVQGKGPEAGGPFGAGEAGRPLQEGGGCGLSAAG